MEKKILKKGDKPRLFGVCDGIGNYLNIDTTIIRLGLVFFSLFYGIGIIMYLAGAILMPPADE
jgi:phage shock protein PspC (stress-responsive transcriptional regulator)